MKKNFNRVLSMLIALVMVISLVPVVATAAAIEPDTTWGTTTGVEGDVYTISDAADLMQFNALLVGGNTFAGKTVKLAANITLNYGSVEDFKNLQSLVEWNGATTFAGTFDGQNYTIYGLYLKATTNNVAFFGTASGTIQNVSFVNAYVNGQGNEQVGCLVGDTSGNLSISNCHISGVMESFGTNVGPFIGRVNKITATISNSSFNGSITSSKTSSKTYVGGMVGFLVSGTSQITISNSVAKGTIIVTDGSKGTCFGGFVGGANNNASCSITVSDCISDVYFDLGTPPSADVTYGDRVGGIAGFFGGTVTVKDTLILGKITRKDGVDADNNPITKSVTSAAIVPSHNTGSSITATNVVVGMDLAEASQVFTAMFNTGYKSKDLAKDPIQPTCTNVVYVPTLVNNTVLTVTVANSARVESTEAPEGVTAATEAALNGNLPAATGWDNWEATDTLPIPTGAKAAWAKANATPSYPQGLAVVTLGDQYKVVDDQYKDYRVVSLVYGYDVANATGIAIGYKFTMTYDQGTVEETYYCTTAYRSIMAGGVALAAADYDGADFFVTMTFKNVPNTATNIKVTVTPFVEAVEGTQVYGQAGSFIWNEAAAAA